MKYGLSENTIKEINSVFSKYNKIETVILFGSRAKGNFTNGSDIDLAVKAKDLSFDEFLSIQIDLDQLELIYKIDFLDYTKIQEPELLDHINRVGILVYQSKNNINPQL